MKKKRIVIVGATSAIAEHCARLWVVQSPVELVLLGRNQAKLEAIATDLRVRGAQSSVSSILADFASPALIEAQIKGIVQSGMPDIVLIAHGTLPDQGQCQDSLSLCHEALSVNAISPALFAEGFAGHMERANAGTLAIIGSVAGDRGRKSNYIYGAAKGLLTRYAQGLQHRLAKTGVKVVLIKPGPTDTPMTAHLRQASKGLASVQDVAGQIVAGIQAGTPTLYVPGKWRLIMMVIRHLPRFIFNKMDI